MTTYTTPSQSIEFKKLNLPEGELKFYQHQSGRYQALLMKERPMFDPSMYIELGPVYSLNQILEILTHYYRISIRIDGIDRYQVSCDHEGFNPKTSDFGNSMGAGKSIAEASGNLLIELITHDKFFTAQVCKDVIKRYISTHE